MLGRGDLLPHFTVATPGAAAVSYSSIWQQRNLVLVLTGANSEAAQRQASALAARKTEFDAGETEVVVTTDAVDGLPSRGVVVADRWGEIVHVAAADPTAPLPDPDELLSWITYTQMRCPECEGETK